MTPPHPAPDRAAIELSFYERFFFSQDREPYPTQEQAFDRIFAGDSVLVTVPTGTGKTMIAKAAIHAALASRRTAIYTTPLRALTEEKFRELAEDFGEERVGFATGDYKVRPEAPVQVVVAEILWNKIYGERLRGQAPADVVVMDEGHYFNDPERGHVWEQTIIGLDPRAQLVILSATIGEAEKFCQWAYLTRRQELHLVAGTERRVPLYHQFREEYLVETARALHAAGETPAIVFGFGREQCFERARLLKSCPRFTTDEERLQIAAACDAALLPRGLGPELRPLLLHGIGVHHAGILPRYKQLVERLTLARLLRFVVSTETIAAGINLPAKRVIFPELRKYVQKKARLLTSAEYHQMSGRAGRPQFDTEGIAITLAPEAIVQELRKERKDAEKGRYKIDEEKLHRSVYARARAEAQKNHDVIWDGADVDRLVSGQAAPLRSQTKITAEQVLAIGLPDLAVEPIVGDATTPGAATATAQVEERGELPASMHLHIGTVIDHLLLEERERPAARRRLAQVTDNLRAMGIVDEHGAQVEGRLINQLRGVDGLFVWFCLREADLDALAARELVEFLVDHDVIHRALTRKDDDKKREWCRNRLRERRRDEPLTAWEDVEAEYERLFPRELSRIEQVHAAFLARVPHPELHGGKVQKKVWAKMQDEAQGFHDFVDAHALEGEEGNLFSYLARVMKFSRMLHEVTALPEFEAIGLAVRDVLSVIDERVLSEGF